MSAGLKLISQTQSPSYGALTDVSNNKKELKMKLSNKVSKQTKSLPTWTGKIGVEIRDHVPNHRRAEMINILLQEGMITKETIVINQVAMSEITMIVKDVTTTHKEDETPIMTFVDKTETMTIVITSRSDKHHNRERSDGRRRYDWIRVNHMSSAVLIN